MSLKKKNEKNYDSHLVVESPVQNLRLIWVPLFERLSMYGFLSWQKAERGSNLSKKAAADGPGAQLRQLDITLQTVTGENRGSRNKCDLMISSAGMMRGEKEECNI